MPASRRWKSFAEKPAAFDPSSLRRILYQLGNNPHHVFAYEAALEHPGVVVLHEANLHHLIADVTIRRGDWDAYLQEVEISGGAEALEYAKRHVRTLERGPQYEIPMLRTILDALARRSSYIATRSQRWFANTDSRVRWVRFRMAPGSCEADRMATARAWAWTSARR